MAGALVHEWIERTGGSENVLDAMAEAFPDADIYSLWSNAPSRYPGRNVYESWIAKSPLRRSKALALPFLPSTWRRIRPRSDYDWMLVSSHLFAHHARFSGSLGDIPKFVYAHTPARYIWNPELDARGNNRLVRAVSPVFQRLDRKRAQEPISIVANSKFVKQRIEDHWGREAQVIYPPVEVDRIQSVADWRTCLVGEEARVAEDLPEVFVLGVSRWIPYKRLDLVILAAETAGLPAVIAGRGPEEHKLRALAEQVSVPVTFVVSPSDELLYTLYQQASVLVFPAVEDFGIVPVEAIAAGTPVVVGPVGGQTESIRDEISGLKAELLAPEALGHALEQAIGLPPFSGSQEVSKFSVALFQRAIRKLVAGGE